MNYFKLDFSLDNPYVKGEFVSDKPFEESDMFRGKVNIDEIGGYIKIIKGKRFGVFMNCGWLFNIVSSDFKKFVEENSFTGAVFQDVKIKSKQIEIEKQFFLMGITGKSGKLYCKKDTYTEKPSVFFPEKKVGGYIGLFIDNHNYDGSDFFSPDGVNFILIEESVKNKLEQSKLIKKYISFEDLNSYFFLDSHIVIGAVDLS